MFFPVVSKNSYQDGQTFYYLGKPLTLKIVNSQKNSAFIENKTLVLNLKKQSKPKIFFNKVVQKTSYEFYFKSLHVFTQTYLGANLKALPLQVPKKGLGLAIFKET
ncbi:MAG TPA: hypothetical protein ENM99_01425 [Desulfurella acetivorans]|uniref:Uncharacterized protein n=1 Tax=Desulfurella acetivorans TaxID=33002 RepID=A0A7C6E9Y3_DESAE|nr:hypothetical protein [Desulfurella acetivorans]